MFIKYKGNTCRILADLSRELKQPIHLKTSEALLKQFFQKIFLEITLEKKMTLITCLPAYLKPFCLTPPVSREVFSEAQVIVHPIIVQAILTVLERHVLAENLIHIYHCFPEHIFAGFSLAKKRNSDPLNKYPVFHNFIH